jgi:tetratricopeptide (TPR) repeat protein/DNA-binding transcriptional ArsR family regulator
MVALRPQSLKMQTQRKFISRFSPGRTDPEDLERINVGRQELLARSVAVLRESAVTENKHHLLFVGPRGSGKTHLLALIQYRLRQQTDLDERLCIAWLNEDETSTSFLDLLLRICRALADRYPPEFPARDIERLAGRERVEAQDLLSQSLLSRIGQRTVLVLIENLDTLFAQLDEFEQRAWRAFVQNHPVFATAATAQSLFAGVSERDQPFFGFFDTTHLQPLSAGEAVELLQRIAQLNQDGALTEFLGTPRGKARVQAVHHLSGGNPRLYIVLSEFITCKSLDELVGPLEGMVDEQLTPYYQERLRWLSPQQRKIVEFLCLRAQPAPVKEIAAALFAEPGSIGSQLQKLRELGYVRPNPRGRESLYELAEPLMRLSMDVKNTRSHQPLRLIVDFLRVWFDRDDLERLSSRCDPAGIARRYLCAALEKARSGQPDLRRELLLHDVESVDVGHCDEDMMERLRLLAEESDEPADWMKFASACLHHRRLSTAVEWLGKVVEQPSAPVGQVAGALVARGTSLGLMGRAQEAIADFTRATQLRHAPVEAVAMALLNRGITLGALGRNEEAIADYTGTIRLRTAHPEQLTLAPPNSLAIFNRGLAFGRIGRTQNAIADLTKVIELSGVRPEQAARALIARGMTLGQIGRAQEAKADFTRVMGMTGVADEVLSIAKGGMAFAAFATGEWNSAMEHLTKFLAGPGNPPPVIAQVSEALIQAIFSQFGSPDVWPARMAQAFALYREHKALVYLGGALVQHLARLRESALNNSGLDQWFAGWKTVVSGDDVMEFPMRLFRTGIAYLKTQPGDEGVLLQLPIEERSLVRLALGLAKEQSE